MGARVRPVKWAAISPWNVLMSNGFANLNAPPTANVPGAMHNRSRNAQTKKNALQYGPAIPEPNQNIVCGHVRWESLCRAECMNPLAYKAPTCNE